MNLDNIVKKSELSSDFYKLVEGSNKMRILTDFTEVNTINTNGKYGGIVTPENQPTGEAKVQMKGWAWAIIRGGTDKDGFVTESELKIVQFGTRILKQLVALRTSDEYRFEAMPMPYDVNIVATDAGTTDVVYTVTPARQNTDVTEAEMAQLNKKKTCADIVALMINKQDSKKETSKVAYPEASVDNIPF